MQRFVKTVHEYIEAVPAHQRELLLELRRVMRANVDADVEETIGYGMIGWSVPHRVYPAGYHCDPKQPLPYIGLAAQKNFVAVYLMTLYIPDAKNPKADPGAWFREAWAATGKKLDMGKSCVRLKKLDDVAFDVLAQAIRRVPTKTYIANYEAVRAAQLAAKASKSKSAAKAPAKKVSASNAKPAAKKKSARAK